MEVVNSPDEIRTLSSHRYGKTPTAPQAREWTIWVCPTCGGLPEPLGDGRQGCGRHLGTTHFRGAGTIHTSDDGPDFVQVRVREVIE